MPTRLALDPFRRRALTLLAVLVATAIALSTWFSRPQGPPSVRYLGVKGMELAAFTGGARMHMTLSTSPRVRMPVTSVSWSVSAQPSGTGGGSVTMSQVTVTRPLDSSTTTLLENLVTGTQSTVTIVVNHVVDKQVVESLHYVLTQSAVLSDKQTAQAGGSTEQVGLSALSVKLQYWKNGSLVSSTTVSAA